MWLVNAWLIFSAFLFTRAVSLTGFGTRVAYLLVRQFGRSMLSLAYSLVASNVVLAPFVPSDTARGGALTALAVIPLIAIATSTALREPSQSGNVH